VKTDAGTSAVPLPAAETAETGQGDTETVVRAALALGVFAVLTMRRHAHYPDEEEAKKTAALATATADALWCGARGEKKTADALGAAVKKLARAKT
jgi:hypothetical protein